MREFFEIFDSLASGTSTPTLTPRTLPVNSEMREIYDALSVDDSRDDVYLSDGVWLSSDGSTSERGK